MLFRSRGDEQGPNDFPYALVADHFEGIYQLHKVC